MTNKDNYTPRPMDVSDIVLPDELVALTEAIAENVHEVWAEGRLKEGWIPGKERNDEKKIHPCIVPYACLPESEKEYDRNTAMQTLKLIMKLGFEIRKR